MSSHIAVGGVIGYIRPDGALGTYLNSWQTLHVETNFLISLRMPCY